MSIDESLYEEVKELPKENFEDWVCEHLKEMGIRCELLTKELIPLTQYNQKDIPDTKVCQFQITPKLILGHFVLSNSAITKDYDELIEMSGRSRTH
ncbi:hypothetical protein [Desulfosporosinus hippei]|uniref:Uncharacterized protein n=1 Tax=Desulfosporosinus hippei DSM 8344 TaxID=1121419 RepID=A0A1G8CHJ4_9FIRM|nr:hypothetical protein [Desulfosporosinus hippei]SDH44703.1 hypothetical protein SAMN05443529_11398 [Desulfosporosinus hippei DSM 8344]